MSGVHLRAYACINEYMLSYILWVWRKITFYGFLSLNATYWVWLLFSLSLSSSWLTTTSFCHVPWSTHGPHHKVTSSITTLRSCLQDQVGLSHFILSLKETVKLSISLACIYRPILYNIQYDSIYNLIFKHNSLDGQNFV